MVGFSYDKLTNCSPFAVICTTDYLLLS